MLNQKIVNELRPGRRTQILRDHQVAGLGVRITPNGVASFVLDYTVHGRRRLATLGRCNDMTLKQARHAAAEWKVRIRQGEDDPLTRRDAEAAKPTVNQTLDRFFDEYVPARQRQGRLAKGTVERYAGQARRTLRPAIGRKRVVDVTRRDIEAMVAALPLCARNRTLAFASRFFNLCEHWELRTQHTNPVRGVERGIEEPRDRVLSADEIAMIAAAVARQAEEFPAAAAAVRFAMITGLRIGEVIKVRWEDVDFERGMVTLPATKTGRRTQVLGTPALELIAAQPRFEGNAYVFTQTRSAPISYFSCRRFFARCAADAGLQDVCLHDLRRTVMTNAAIAGIGVHVLRDMLGHKTTTMADRYIRRTGSALVEATERSSAAMAAMMDGSSSADVIPFRKRAADNG